MQPQVGPSLGPSDRRPGRAQREPGPITTGGDHGSPLSRGRPQMNPWVRFAKMTVGFVSPKRAAAAVSCPGRSAARSGALQTRDRSSLWRSRISGAPLHFVTRCTVFGTRDSVGHVRSLIHFSNSPSRSRGAFFASGACNLASLTRIEGWAERRETFGCSAEHPWARILRQRRA